MESEIRRRSNEEAGNYRGVRKRKWGKWVSEIRLPNSRERIWLGSYDSPEKAARAFDAALFCLRGNNANFNFPDQPPNIPGGTDLQPSQIQAAAADYANSISPSLPSPVLPELTSFTSTEYDHHQVSFLMDHTNSFPDYGIFPGFDDYFMQPPPFDYQEEEQVVYDSQADPSFLWSF